MKTTRDTIITESRVTNRKNRCSGLDFTTRAGGKGQQGKHGNQDYRGVFKKSVEGGMNRWNTRDLGDSEIILYDMTVVDTYPPLNICQNP